MSSHLPGFQPFSGLLHHFVLAKLATSSSIRDKEIMHTQIKHNDNGTQGLHVLVI